MTPFANDQMGPKKILNSFYTNISKTLYHPTYNIFACGIRNPGMRNTAQEIRNHTYDWNPESMAWNPESKTVFGATLYKRQRYSCTIYN